MIAQIRKLYLDCYPAATIMLPAALFIAIFFSGCLLALLQPRIYESAARLWIQPKLPTEQQSAENIYAPLAFSFTNALSTACELIKSESVLTDSIATLKKKSARGDSPGLAEIATGLSVVTAKNADVVIVSYRAKDPKLAMEVVRAVTDSFIKLNS